MLIDNILTSSNSSIGVGKVDNHQKELLGSQKGSVQNGDNYRNNYGDKKGQLRVVPTHTKTVEDNFIISPYLSTSAQQGWKKISPSYPQLIHIAGIA
jgi:hypothetical protein